MSFSSNPNSYPVILIEDDDDLREAIGVTLRMNKIEFFTHQRAETVIPILQPGMKVVIVTDYKLPGMTGIDLLKTALEVDPELPIIMMTAFADAKLAVQALKAGARDFLIKPFVPEQLVETIRRYQPVSSQPTSNNPTSSGSTKPATNSTSSGLKLSAGQQRSASQAPPQVREFIAEDPAMLATLSRVKRVAPSDTSVLLTGESGVGKEVVAKHIHQLSQRHAGPYIALNCAAIPETLLESILFGHEKGSFTGAAKTQQGKFEQAHGGTLFLDEIGEMPAQLQAKLLRVLQDRLVEKLGSSESVQVDVRIIAATKRHLQDRVKAGQFREDLYFRLAVFPIHIPELRIRKLDILPLSEFFLVRYSQNVRREGMYFHPLAKELLVAYDWPGNVRELENTIQRAILMSDDEQILAEHLELPIFDELLSNLADGAVNTKKADDPEFEPYQAKQLISRKKDDINHESGTEIAYISSKNAGNMESVERDHILKVLDQVGGNKTKAVEILGISDRALRYKLKSYREAGFDVD